MNPKAAKESYAPVPTAITINAQGQAVPRNATLSLSQNGGANFNASYACTLTFTNPPGCPFQNCSSNTLSLGQGPNPEGVSGSPAPGTVYTYTVSAPPDRGPMTDQFDITISS